MRVARRLARRAIEAAGFRPTRIAFRYRGDDRLLRPHTTAVSDVDPFPLTAAATGIP